jgi:hypothetical protein
MVQLYPIPEFEKLELLALRTLQKKNKVKIQITGVSAGVNTGDTAPKQKPFAWLLRLAMNTSEYNNNVEKNVKDALGRLKENNEWFTRRPSHGEPDLQTILHGAQYDKIGVAVTDRYALFLAKECKNKDKDSETISRIFKRLTVWREMLVSDANEHEMLVGRMKITPRRSKAWAEQVFHGLRYHDSERTSDTKSIMAYLFLPDFLSVEPRENSDPMRQIYEIVRQGCTESIHKDAISAATTYLVDCDAALVYGLSIENNIADYMSACRHKKVKEYRVAMLGAFTEWLQKLHVGQTPDAVALEYTKSVRKYIYHSLDTATDIGTDAFLDTGLDAQPGGEDNVIKQKTSKLAIQEDIQPQKKRQNTQPRGDILTTTTVTTTTSSNNPRTQVALATNTASVSSFGNRGDSGGYSSTSTANAPSTRSSFSVFSPPPAPPSTRSSPTGTAYTPPVTGMVPYGFPPANTTPVSSYGNRGDSGGYSSTSTANTPSTRSSFSVLSPPPAPSSTISSPTGTAYNPFLTDSGSFDFFPQSSAPPPPPEDDALIPPQLPWLRWRLFKESNAVYHKLGAFFTMMLCAETNPYLDLLKEKQRNPVFYDAVLNIQKAFFSYEQGTGRDVQEAVRSLLIPMLQYNEENVSKKSKQIAEADKGVEKWPESSNELLTILRAYIGLVAIKNQDGTVRPKTKDNAITRTRKQTRAYTTTSKVTQVVQDPTETVFLDKLQVGGSGKLGELITKEYNSVIVSHPVLGQTLTVDTGIEVDGNMLFIQCTDTGSGIAIPGEIELAKEGVTGKSVFSFIGACCLVGNTGKNVAVFLRSTGYWFYDVTDHAIKSLGDFSKFEKTDEYKDIFTGSRKILYYKRK